MIKSVACVVNLFLRAAAARDALALVKLLVAAGANPYDTDETGHTAFNRAASNSPHALAWLTETAFADTKKPAAQRRWKNYGLNTPSGYYGSTLITYAAKVCSAAVVRQMVEAGADITITNGSGWTLLHCTAVMPGRTEVLQELLRMFRKSGIGDTIDALSTQPYETSYNGHMVVYTKNLTAAGLCRARMEQDTHYPRELSEYLTLLSQ